MCWHSLAFIFTSILFYCKELMNVRGSECVWWGVICGAAAGEADAPAQHPQSGLAGFKNLYWVLKLCCC